MLNKEEREQMGLRIKNLRKAKSLTQQDLADVCNVGAKHISCVERGLIGLSDETLILLCINLNVTTDYILTGQISDNTLSLPIVTLYNKIPSSKRRYLEDITKALAMMFEDE